jgi:regulator of sigma D
MSELNSTDLLRDHAVIERFASQLALLIERDADAAALSRTLDHLVETVADHLSVEDAMIYTLAMRARSGGAHDSVERMRNAFEQLKADWGVYLQRWTPEAITADREEFVRATRVMLPRLRDRVRLENELLCALTLDPDFKEGTH